MYNAFLIIRGQLASGNTARAVIEDHRIFFEVAPGQKRWKISTQVFSGEDFLPESVRACVSSKGTFHWQSHGAYLKLDSKTFSVFLVEEIEMELDKYIPFKKHLSDFLSVAAEWRTILQTSSERDRCFSSI